MSEAPTIQAVQPLATGLLLQAAEILGTRAADRDVQQERTMGDIVKVFNAFTDHKLTEADGWAFMVLLKMVRSRRGKSKDDDYIDGAAYIALMGEAVANERAASPAAA